MASDKHLLDIATRHQVYLERLKSGQVKSMGTALRRLEKAITEVVGGLGTANMADLTKKQLNETLTRLRNEQARVMLEMLDELMPALEELAGYEASFEAKSIEQAAAAVSLTVPVASAAYKAALQQPLSATGELLEPFLKDWTAKEIAAVNNLVRKGYADGWTNQQLVQAIRGTKKLNYADGIVARIGRNADAVVRTAVQHVASTARMETWANNADIITGYRFVATLDNKTTPICRSLDGQVFELGKGPRPPVHIRCRSTTVAEVDDKYDFLDAGATRSSSAGYVDGDLTYYEWLKTQPEAFQDSAIGPTRGKLLRDGGLTAEEFARLNLGRNFEPLTLPEMQELEPVAFQRAGLPLQPRVSRPRQYEVLTKPESFTEAWKRSDAAVNGGPFARSTFDRYIGNTKVSSALRRDFEYANQVSDIQEDVAAMTAVIDSGGLTKDLVAYRGLNAGVLDGLKIGDSFTDEAFMSATPYAESPFIKETKKHGGHLMTIRLPQGAKGRYITSPTFDKFYSEEHELLLQRNTTLKVVDIIEHKGYREYVFDYVKSAPEEYNFYNHLTKMSTAEVGKLVSAYYQRRAASGVSMDLLSAEFAKHNFAAKTKEELVAFLRGVQFDPFNPGQ